MKPILVLYTGALDQEEIEKFRDSTKNIDIEVIIAFLPSEGYPRLECINPVIASDDQKLKIDKILAELEAKLMTG